MATEKVFLLTKASRYFYDAEAVKEDASENSHSHGQGNGEFKDYHDGRTGRHQAYQPPTRNMRNWWLLGPSPYPEAHFATFPPEVPRRAILAGTSERGVCAHCGAPWARVVEKSSDTRQSKPYTGAGQKGTPNGSAVNFKVVRAEGGSSLPTSETTTLGWRATCRCAAEAPIAATVLDPFLGAGTTALVADRLGRDCIGIELSADYAAMAEGRVRGDAPLLVQLAAD